MNDRYAKVVLSNIAISTSAHIAIPVSNIALTTFNMTAIVREASLPSNCRASISQRKAEFLVESVEIR